MTAGLLLTGSVLSITAFLFGYRVLRVGHMDRSGKAILVSSVGGVGVLAIVLLILLLRS